MSTIFLGDSINAASSSLSKRLGIRPLCNKNADVCKVISSLSAKRTECQCFVSLNIKDPNLGKLAEEHIIRLYEKDPHLFFIQ